MFLLKNDTWTHQDSDTLSALADTENAHLADVGHLSRFVRPLHVPKESSFTDKLQLTDLTLRC